jgi:hypothetical protein
MRQFKITARYLKRDCKTNIYLDLLQSYFEYEKEKTIKEVNMLKNELSRFESTYQISSKVFFEKFEKGDIGDQEDYFEWSAMYQMYERSVGRFSILESPSA